jgi:hypothetical protein
MAGSRTYFLISCARSGSTSLTKIFGEATNGCCLSEPAPTLAYEARELWDGRLTEPTKVVERNLLPRVREHSTRHAVYGEKNVTLGFFLPQIHQALGSKFVFLRRDGRDVVRSLMDWHNKKFGSIYRECRDPGDLNEEARRAAGRLPIHEDTSDYGRPRPRRGSALYAEWESLSREEMCAYYWTEVNQLFLNHLEALPQDSWTALDYTAPTADAIIDAARFCGLEGLDEPRVEKLLSQKINSLGDRGGQTTNNYPDWRSWDGGQRRRFTRIAGDGMRRLGYFQGKSSDWKPAGYGKCWNANGGKADWYTWMHEYRKPIHQAFFDWVARREQAGETIDSIADFGCGLGIGYCEHFASKRFTGVDLDLKNIEWCQKNRSNKLHSFVSIDFMTSPLPVRSDVVTSSGTIDNCYDVEAFLESMIQSAQKWIYLTCYRGWFPELAEHKYLWAPGDGCFYNDISPQRVREYLQGRGCNSIVIEPLRSSNSVIPYETCIIARVPGA